jgi:hypothetical protein
MTKTRRLTYSISRKGAGVLGAQHERKPERGYILDLLKAESKQVIAPMQV